MRLEWLEDILAVLETGSLNRAAERRFLTQPAFSRRMKTIEDYAGVELLDRSRKPAQLKRPVRDQRARIQELASGLRDLLHELKRQDRETQNRIVIASQHAITTSHAPGLVKRLSSDGDMSIRLRSANRDECYALLMTKQADVTLLYQSDTDELVADDDFLDVRDLGEEKLVPVFATDELARLNADYAAGELPVIAYPPDVFLGKVVNQEVFANIGNATFIRRKAETALTLAIRQLALAGVGVAWLPASLVSTEIRSGVLTELSDVLPTGKLTLIAIRVTGAKTDTERKVWEAIGEMHLPH